MSTNDSEPWIIKEIEFITHTVTRGVPVLGVCLGAQLLAKGLGAPVKPGPRMELGPMPITVTQERQRDPVFSTFPKTFEVFQWHGEGFDLPEGAVSLASSELYAPQAFRFGPRVYGLLFHLELEAKGIEALCRECPDAVHHGGTTPELLLSAGSKILSQSHEWANRLIAHMTVN